MVETQHVIDTLTGRGPDLGPAFLEISWLVRSWQLN